MKRFFLLLGGGGGPMWILLYFNPESNTVQSLGGKGIKNKQSRKKATQTVLQKKLIVRLCKRSCGSCETQLNLFGPS
jgi:hypothetical protein